MDKDLRELHKAASLILDWVYGEETRRLKENQCGAKFPHTIDHLGRVCILGSNHTGPHESPMGRSAKLVWESI